jgi:hypothetical protein
MEHLTTDKLRSVWGQPLLQESFLKDHLIQHCDACRPRFEATKRHIYQQAAIDNLVIATLERSELLPNLKPLNEQRRDERKEDYVNRLFEVLNTDAEEEASY